MPRVVFFNASMLTADRMNVGMLSVIFMNVSMLGVVQVNFIILNVEAPGPQTCFSIK